MSNPADESADVPTDRSVHGPRPLSRRKKILFSGVVIAACFALIEGLLAVLGVPSYRNSYDPTLGLTPGVSLFVRDGADFRTNDAKRTYFNAQRFPAHKSPNAFRIFCLGGSTTFGHPYDDRLSYSAMLRKLLGEVAPERDWQVVNCGGISYASYRMAGLMTELCRYDPDLVIVYAGENEFLEERTYRDVPVRSPWIAGGIRLIGPLRLATVIHRVIAERPTRDQRLPPEVNTILDNTIGPETYHRNAGLRRQVIEQYRSSLLAIDRLAQGRTMFIIPASNLRFSPFKSERSASAPKLDVSFSSRMSRLRRAVQEQNWRDAVPLAAGLTAEDPLFADAQFYAGEALLGARSVAEARIAFRAALDEDVCPLRAITPIVEAMREVAAQLNRPVIDFPAIVEQASRELNGHGIPGNETFLDHVHPRPELHVRLAGELVRTIAGLGHLSGLSESRLTAAADRVAQTLSSQLSQADRAMALNNLAQVLSWAGKNEEAFPLAREAVELDPDNVWILCQLGRLQEKFGQTAEALKTHRRAVELDPNDAWAQYRLGKILLMTNDPKAAQPHLERGLVLTPSHAPLSVQIAERRALADCHEQLGDAATAARLRDEADRIGRHSPNAGRPND